MNATRTMLKCTRWQLEQTTDLVTCPYLYYCDSPPPAPSFPIHADLLAASLTVLSFASVAAFTVSDFRRSSGSAVLTVSQRYLLPSGPLILPLLLLVLAKGHRIDTIFQVTQLGPALFQLLQISALAFRNDLASTLRNDGATGDLRYTVLEASTVSGVLHAGLYLDTVTMPYYTGLDAAKRSRPSGVCPSCVCRMEPLVAGGETPRYHGMSKTTMVVVLTLCARMLCRVFGDERPRDWARDSLEWIGWAFLARDAAYMAVASTMSPELEDLEALAYAGVCVLVSLNVLIKLYRLLAWVSAEQRQWKSSLWNSAV